MNDYREVLQYLKGSKILRILVRDATPNTPYGLITIVTDLYEGTIGIMHPDANIQVQDNTQKGEE